MGQRWSLNRLVEEVLSLTLPKPTGVRCGDWDCPTGLRPAQQQYAAADAVAAMLIFQRLVGMPDARPPARLPRPPPLKTGLSVRARGPVEVVAALPPGMQGRLRISAERVYERWRQASAETDAEGGVGKRDTAILLGS